MYPTTRSKTKMFRKDQKTMWDEEVDSKILKRQLSELGLTIKDVEGDGNCLFRALSDQLDGNTNNHSLYRRMVCEHLKANPELYEAFCEDESFEKHVDRMNIDGCYGGNIELVAFSRIKNVDIYIHQANQNIWKVSSQQNPISIIHIAYWGAHLEHYSSIRNIKGPKDGPSSISLSVLDKTKLKDMTGESVIVKNTNIDNLPIKSNESNDSYFEPPISDPETIEKSPSPNAISQTIIIPDTPIELILEPGLPPSKRKTRNKKTITQTKTNTQKKVCTDLNNKGKSPEPIVSLDNKSSPPSLVHI